ncbi:MAG TPA: hypothetical protein VNN77_08835 [candidate division Zixibacteria bacterium]|nr:hypothetical protein [candidate division Zixibacteria bacterium]
MSEAWIIIGAVENWRAALNQPIPLWGLRESYGKDFARLPTSGVAWLYATSPVKGVIGLAVIREKYIDESTPLWPEEIQKRRVIWPLRFRLEVTKLIPETEWESAAIAVNDFRLFWQKGFQKLSAEQNRELAERFLRRYRWNNFRDIENGPTIESPAMVAEAPRGSEPPHRRLQEILAEVGRLQHYHSQLEYPIAPEGSRKTLDVVWKREMSGVPAFAFQVEFSGAVEQAVLRLKFAYDNWNSRPCIVAPSDVHRPILDIVSSQPAAFAASVRLCSDGQILELHRRKQELRSLEQQLGIY